MLSVLTHFLLLVAACFALFRLWRATRTDIRWVNAAIAVGFLGRAFAGEALFWISYLRLPIARSLQIGEGLWFFAIDALLYLPTSQNLARHGLKAILTYPPGGPSVTFVQSLAATMFLLGDAASVAVLLNLFCYLGMIAVIVHWNRREPRARIPAAVAICAISLSPAVFLWSLQPQKDTFFQFIVVAFVGACAAWQRAMISPPLRWRSVLGMSATMFAALYVIAGVRWYFALALLLAVTVFLLLIAAMSRVPKGLAFATSAVLLVVLSRALVLGSGPYLPNPIAHGLSPWMAKQQAAETSAPKVLLTELQRTRAGFEEAGGNTAIRVGGSLSHLDRALSDAPRKQLPPKQVVEAREMPKPVEPEVETAPVPVQQETQQQPSRQQQTPPPPPMASEFQSTPVQTTTVTKTTAATPTTATAPPAATPAPPTPAPQQTASAAPIPAATPAPSVPAPVTNTAPSAPPPARRDAAPPAGETPAATPAPKKAKPHVHKAAPPPAPAPAPAPSPASLTVHREPPPQFVNKTPPPPPEERAKSTTARLLIGTASVVVPRSVGEWLGLFHIGGGHGMLWFTELDTLVFDGMLLWVLIVLATRFRVSWRNPLLWFVALLTILVAGPLAYTITNYGTLFRLRAMIYVALLLTPLALASMPRREPGEEPLRAD